MAAATTGAAAAPPDDEAISRLMATTGADMEQARFLLEAANGNFDAAAHMYFEHMPTSSQQQHTPPRPRAPREPTPSGGAAPPPGARNVAAAYPRGRGPGGLLGRALQLPIFVLRTAFGVVTSVAHMGLTIAAFAGDTVLPRSVMRRARAIATAVAEVGGSPLDPAQQAAQFVAAFNAAYGERVPAFLEQGWSQATSAAHAQFKFLFVYLHSPDHEDTETFCRSVLCSPEVLSYVGEQFVAWGGDIRRADAFTLSSRLHVTTYPAVALLAYPGSRTKVVACLQGRFTAAQLLAALRRAVEEHGVLLTAERLQQEEREMSRTLLEEQNREYEEALAADREKAQRRQQERERAEAEAREREERERAERAVQEAAENRLAKAAEALTQRRAAAAASLAPEPPAGARAAVVRVRLPDGSNHSRRFEAAAPVDLVYRWVDGLDGCTFWQYSLVCNFPRRVYGPDARALSLEEAGLAPQGVLFVQVEDDEDLGAAAAAAAAAAGAAGGSGAA
ncbi:hypothetical protein Rsub_12292 [Raphidocelis subcapitata]|uniref:UBX domain-containing protein n=1 Tax=Raphidocelis subcapitata TaxID=307507 RepID=A0A2V0PNF0_9CHLO|nr:hypothetical protein Rsub_12292 [Raphidocelis subcapitata]|eukprot:GBF99613.1 hypothetical protein Rsub_12292 [Raphidocelis subcapitata]